MGVTGLPKTCLSACQSNLSISSLWHKPVFLCAMHLCLAFCRSCSQPSLNCASNSLCYSFILRIYLNIYSTVNDAVFITWLVFYFFWGRSVSASCSLEHFSLCLPCISVSSHPTFTCVSGHHWLNHMSNYPFDDQLIAMTFHCTYHIHSTLLYMISHLQYHHKTHLPSSYFWKQHIFPCC